MDSTRQKKMLTVPQPEVRRPGGEEAVSFDGQWNLDEDFVAEALVTEPSADERAREAARRSRAAQLESLLAQEAAREASHRKRIFGGFVVVNVCVPWRAGWLSLPWGRACSCSAGATKQM